MRKDELQALLDSLTFEEKVGQLCQGTPELYGEDGVPTGINNNNRLGANYVQNLGSILNVKDTKRIRKIQEEHLKHSKVPLVIMADIIFGCKTIFPISLGLACSFNPELVKHSAEITAKETAATGINVTFSPMVDVARDARWGRCSEGYGEDVLLNCEFAKAMVKGYQGDDLSSKHTIAACVKHFAGYGATYDGRDYSGAEMGERRLYQDYLPAYKSAVDAKTAMLMTSYNTIDGVPISMNPKLTVDTLRKDWGFSGTVISDYGTMLGAVREGAANDLIESAALNIKAKVDIDMTDAVYFKHLKDAVDKGLVKVQEIDEAVMRVLELKNKLGILDDPYKYVQDDELISKMDITAHLETAKEAIYQSSVLLKNDNDILPLSDKDSVAFIGPFVDKNKLYSLWSEVSIHREDGNSVADVIESRYGKEKFVCEPGCPVLYYDEFSDDKEESEIYGKEAEYLNRAVHAAKKSKYVVMTLGEHKTQYGESRSRSNLKISESQMNLFREIQKVNENIIVVLYTGRPLEIVEIASKAKAILNVWYPGTMGSEAIVDMVFGKAVPSGKLSMSFPYNAGQCPIYYSVLPTSHYHPHGQHNPFNLRFIDIPNSPLYEFGFGLSYANFEYSDLTLSQNQMKASEKIKISVNVTNTSEVEALETVQLYLHDVATTLVSRPMKELKAFKKVLINPLQTVKVEFEINEEMLKFYDYKMDYLAEKGKFEVFVGKSSSDCLKEIFEYLG